MTDTDLLIQNLRRENEALRADVKALRLQIADLKNTLYWRCGRYLKAHEGACKGCKFEQMPKEVNDGRE